MPLKKFDLDLSGIKPENKITDEIHLSVDVNSGILIPEFKNFFTESFEIKNNTDVILQRNTDWIPIEFNQEASLRCGKEICNGIILLTNLDNYPFKLTYQVIGGPETYSASNLLETYLAKVSPDAPVPYEDITDKPLEFPPKHHLHDADEMYGLEYIVRKLQRIEQALHIGSFPTFKDLLAFIDTSLVSIQGQMNYYLDQTMNAEYNSFIAEFTKQYLNIENLANLKPSTEIDGFKIGDPNYSISQITENKYVLLETLIGLKRALYKNLIRKDTTGLDLILGTYIEPFEYSARDLLNRGVFNVISKQSAYSNDVLMSESLYPLEVLPTSELVITKLSNETDSCDGDLLLVEKSTNSLFWGNAVEELEGITLNWKKITEESRLKAILDTLNTHIENKNNPHGLTKNQIGLNNVENLSVVTKEEIDNLTSVRKYLTFDALLYLARKHLLENGPASPITSESENKFLLDNAVVIYSPGGKCDGEKVDPKVTGLDGTFRTEMTIGWAINGGSSGTKFKMRYGMIGTTPVEKEYTLTANGTFIGYLPTGTSPGTIQSIFTFAGGQVVVTNTLVQESACPAAEPEPTPTPTPEPPAPTPVPSPSAGVTPSSVTITGETGAAIDYLAGQLSNAVPTGQFVAMSGSLAPGLTMTISTTAVLGSYAIRITGIPTEAGSFNGVYRFVCAEDKYADITINCNIAAARVPDLTLASDKTIIYPTTNETITITASGGKPNSTVNVKVIFSYLSGKYKNIEKMISISLNNSGNGVGTVAGGNPAMKCIDPCGNARVTGGLPLGNWQVKAMTVNTNPIKQSNGVTRKLAVKCSCSDSSRSS